MEYPFPSMIRVLNCVGPRQVEFMNQPLSPPGPQDVIVRSTRSLISAGTECAVYAGDEWKSADGSKMPQYPAPQGYSHVGEVIAVGKEVQNCTPGDHVTSTSPHSNYAMIRPPRPWWSVPKGVSDEAAAFTVLGCTVLNGVRLGPPQLGDSVVIVGLGILGQLACQFVRLSGARTVIGIDTDKHRLKTAKLIGGVTHTVDAREDEVPEVVSELTAGRGADIVYEVTGRTETFDLCFQLARRRATVVSLGSPRWPAAVDMMQVHLKALNLVGAIVDSHPVPGEANRWTRAANGDLFLQLLADGSVKVEELVTHHMAAADAGDAYDRLVSRQAGMLGVILDWL